jgi:hypothetical protein
MRRRPLWFMAIRAFNRTYDKFDVTKIEHCNWTVAWQMGYRAAMRKKRRK